MGNRTVKTQRRMGSAVFPRCRLFGQEEAMTDTDSGQDLDHGDSHAETHWQCQSA